MKLKAYQCEPECLDARIYYEFDPDIIITGNRELADINTDYPTFSNIYNTCIARDDLPDVIDDFESYYYDTPAEAIKDLLEFTPDPSQVKAITKAVKAYNAGRMAESTLITTLLTIIEKRPWNCETIRGYCQRDWNLVYYPAALESEIRTAEAYYFSMLTEYRIETEEGDEFYTCFTDDDAWNLDTLKKLISAEYSNTAPEDVTIFNIDHYDRTPVYKEAQ